MKSSEPTVQLNHVYDKANGDLENFLDDVTTTKPHVPVSAVIQRRSSVSGAAVVRPVNGLRTREHNLMLQRLAVVEVKKPGKGRFDSILTILCYVHRMHSCCCKIKYYLVNCVTLYGGVQT